MPMNLTEECRKGYDAAADATPPYLFSSDSWMAWWAGYKIRGMSGIRACRKSRGHSVRIETAAGSVVIVRFSGSHLELVTVERSP